MGIKVILVDDHPLVREGVASMLDQDKSIEVVARYADTNQLLSGLKYVAADVLLLDLQLAQSSSDIAIPVIKEKYPRLKILILSSNDNVHGIKYLLNKGADGYLLKNTDQDFLIQAIKETCAGTGEHKIVSRETAANLKKLSEKDVLFLNRPSQLTPRETEVLQLIARELTSQEIGERLHLSQRTVESYRLLIMQKLDVKNMVGMVKKAILLGLVRD